MKTPEEIAKEIWKEELGDVEFDSGFELLVKVSKRTFAEARKEADQREALAEARGKQELASKILNDWVYGKRIIRLVDFLEETIKSPQLLTTTNECQISNSKEKETAKAEATKEK